jgi:hypothetical protein
MFQEERAYVAQNCKKEKKEISFQFYIFVWDIGCTIKY